MVEKKLYLKINDFRGYDEFYSPLNSKEKTWKEILDLVEQGFDQKYGENGDKLLGIKMSFEIVDTLPADIDAEF